MILPLLRDDDRLSALSNYYSFAYAPLYEGAPTPAQRQALLTQVARQLRRDHGRVTFHPLIGDTLARQMRDAFAAAGWIALLTDQNSNHYLDIKGRDFATYWAGRPGRLRSSVKRKGKGQPYSYHIETVLTDALWDDYLTVYNASWKNAEPYPAMVRAIAEDAAARGVLRLGFARENRRAVAVQLWTIEGETACIHKIAHDSADDHGSPGTLLSHFMFEQMIDGEKVARIDYGTGNNAYKRDWMEEAQPMTRLDCFNPRRAGMWLPALRTRISQLVRKPG